MISVLASVQEDEEIPDGAGYQSNFKTIWVGGGGNIALSRDAGVTFTTYTAVPGSGDFTRSGNYIGTLAQGTTATGLVAGIWRD